MNSSNLSKELSTDQYQQTSKGHKMFTLLVTVTREHIIAAKDKGDYRKTGMSQAIADEVIYYHPLSIALKHVFPNPAVFAYFLVPNHRHGEPGESLWFPLVSQKLVARWDDTDFETRGDMPSFTVAMDIREETILKYGLQTGGNIAIMPRLGLLGQILIQLGLKKAKVYMLAQPEMAYE